MLEQSLILLFSGMLTVFTVLGLVVLMGRFLIYIVNNFFPNPVQSENVGKTQAVQQTTNETLAVITAAVDIATAGKGRVAKVELISSDDEIRI